MMQLHADVLSFDWNERRVTVGWPDPRQSDYQMITYWAVHYKEMNPNQVFNWTFQDQIYSLLCMWGWFIYVSYLDTKQTYYL